MPNRNAEKIRRRREKLLEDKTPAAVPRSNNLWFWILFAVLLSTTAILVYLSVTNNSANELIVPIVFSILALLVVLVWFLPKFYVRSLPIESGKDFDREKERLKLEDDTRKTIAQIVGGAVILGSLIFTYNTFHLQQDLYRLQQEGQFTDRFTKAVAQLGDNKLEVRLGGLYALERIAKDSPKDHWTVMEILSAFIREKAKKVDIDKKSGSSEKINNNTDELKTIPKLPTDIQTALTIIGRRKIEQDSSKDIIDLSETNLDKANLSETNLSGANLTNISFSEANLMEANLKEWTKLGFSDFSDANLYGADLSSADMSNVSLKNANLEVTNLSRTYLFGANLSGAKAIGTNLNDAILARANTDEADLNGAYLIGTDLRETNLRLTKNLTFEQLKTAIIDEKTVLPDFLSNRKSELLEISKTILQERYKFTGLK